MRRVLAQIVFVLWVLSHTVASAQTQSWGDLKVRFRFDGRPPKPQKISDQVGAGFCGDTSLVDESLIVNTINRGVRHIVVYAYQGAGGRKLKALHATATSQPKTLELANVRCNYVPRILVMQRGDALRIVNTDIIGYNAMFGFVANESKNFALPGKSKTAFTVEAPEPAPIPVECTIYPWMKARLLVLEHRYSAISNANGEIVIRNLPAGQMVAFRIYHEKARFPGLAIGEASVNKRGVFDVEIKPGENDLGTIDIAPQVFGL